jgi:hypothetical protein
MSYLKIAYFGRNMLQESLSYAYNKTSLFVAGSILKTNHYYHNGTNGFKILRWFWNIRGLSLCTELILM